MFRRSGLLSMNQQQQAQSQQQQSQRGVIGQLPSMQGHSSPSHSPGLNINSNKMGVPPSRSAALPPPSSNTLPNSSATISNTNNFPGFIGGQIHRSMSAGSNLGQVKLN